jgi:hypothetical protein
MPDRFWPARRWLADRLVGDHAYSKNVATWGVNDIIRNDATGELFHVTTAGNCGIPRNLILRRTSLDPISFDPRNPQETA